MVDFNVLGPLILEAEELVFDGAPQESIDAVVAKIRALGPHDPSVQAAILQLGFTVGESADTSMSDCADKTLNEVDRDSWDYNGEDARASPDVVEKAKKLSAFAKRQP